VGLIGECDVVGVHASTDEELLVFEPFDGFAAAKAGVLWLVCV